MCAVRITPTMTRMPSPKFPTDTAVLVVGAGPAGLAAALELTRHDVPVVLVERRSELSTHPRATGASTRSMELIRAWGLEEDVRARSSHVEWSMLDTESLAQAASGTALEVGYPSPEQSRMISPTAPACLAQDELEPLLLDRIEASPHARVEFGAEVAGIMHRPGGVRATLRDGRTLDARYVIAADGARSAVRSALEISMDGPEAVMVGYQTLFHAPLWEVVGAHRHVIYWVAPAEAAFVPAGKPDRWLFGMRNVVEEPDPRHAAEQIRLTAGVPGLPVRVVGSRAFSAASQVATRFRSGDVFLAGDAAHRVTPRGATGMNLALHDGYDLGWKLGWVLRGWAGPELLDSYEAERRPVAEYAAVRSADASGSLRPPETEVHVDIGSRIAHVPVAGGSTLDLLGPGLTLFASRGDGNWMHGPTTGVPIAVERLEPVVARALGAPAGSALLARPDGTPVALVRSPDELRAAVAGTPVARAAA